MNFNKKRKTKQYVDSKYERLLFYKEAPAEEISLEEFERYAIDRLKLLREIENINIRFKRGSDEYKSKMDASVKEFLTFQHKAKIHERLQVKKEKSDKEEFVYRGDAHLLENTVMENQIIEQRKDRISHFILRLAFARSEDLRRWFLTQELELFRFRFQDETLEQKDEFMKQNNLLFDLVSDEEKNNNDLLSKLREAKFSHPVAKSKMAQFEIDIKETYYKVPFTDVLDLVKSRRVFLHKGSAYVPYDELISIIIGIYRTHLSQALAITARKLPYLEEDTRLLPMLKNLSSAYIGDTYTSKKVSNDEKLSLNEIDQASKISYPICMRNLHEGLRKDHHLKHFGRLQYGLFIKAAGLSLEEALTFWRSEFTKTMDVDKFEKQYAYNVRHSYGKEGKRADYTPYSCLKVITTNQPGPGDFHGCPFKHSDVDVLQRRLQSYKIPKETINEISELVKRQHYQVACARYFEVTHKLPEGTASINHPNEYFDESKRTLRKRTDGSSATPRVKQEIKQEPRSEVKKKASDTTSNQDLGNLGDFDEAMDIL